MLTSRLLTLVSVSLMIIAVRQAAGFATAEDPSRFGPANLASPYVPLDSWVYSAFEFLTDKGYVQSAFFDLRPWTRLECARLIEEADELSADQSVDPQIARSLKSLKQEFAPELARRAGARNAEVLIDSVYERTTAISGEPLTDGYHFAETLVNDDGRPFGRGLNNYFGLTARATFGPFAAFIRSEMQRVPEISTPDALAEQQIALVDFTPEGQAGPASGFLRGRLIDAGFSFVFANNQLTFGKQQLWWGPARSSSTIFSNNAEPVTMLRFDRVSPIEFAGPLRLLGPVRMQLFLGRLSGTQYVHTDHMTFGSPDHALTNQPWIHGEKFTFEPTPNFQFGISRTVLFAGQGAPFTASTFLRSIFSTGTGAEEEDPGDRRVGFDARYKIPGIRSCLTGYVDSFTEDESFPPLYPRRSTWISGFALGCFPKTSHLTLRAEGLISPHRDEFPGYYYFNVHYLSGYTNNRQLIGSWIGREGHGEQLWATWQISPRSSVELSSRSMNASADFLQGGFLRDLDARADFALRPEWEIHISAQSEWWRFPLLSVSEQKNSTFTLQLCYQPHWGTR
jgi:hypothetical protein